MNKTIGGRISCSFYSDYLYNVLYDKFKQINPLEKIEIQLNNSLEFVLQESESIDPYYPTKCKSNFFGFFSCEIYISTTNPETH